MLVFVVAVCVMPDPLHPRAPFVPPLSFDGSIVQGRFHHVLHVAPPNAAERELLLGYFAAKCGLPVTTSGVQAVRGLQARLKDGMSGAEIENICKEAALSLYSQQLAQV